MAADVAILENSPSPLPLSLRERVAEGRVRGYVELPNHKRYFDGKQYYEVNK